MKKGREFQTVDVVKENKRESSKDTLVRVTHELVGENDRSRLYTGNNIKD